MPFNLLLLPLLGGFIFISRWNRTRWYALRAEKERLIFYAAIAGSIWLLIVYLAKFLLLPLLPCYDNVFCLSTWWTEHIGIAYSGVCFATFLLSSLAWIPLNEIGVWNRDAQAGLVVESQGGSLEKFLNKAMQEGLKEDEPFYVLLTLKGGKVYVGRVVSAFEPGHRDQTILLFPTLSGYRSKDSQEVAWSVDYDEVYAKMERDFGETVADLKKEEFRIVIPVAEIVSTTRFDYQVYFSYFSPEAH